MVPWQKGCGYSLGSALKSRDSCEESNISRPIQPFSSPQETKVRIYLTLTVQRKMHRLPRHEESGFSEDDGQPTMNEWCFVRQTVNLDQAH